MLKPKTSIELMHNLESENLVLKLIEQLNKDFELANIDKHFDLELSAQLLYNNLSAEMLNLLKYKYDDYLNLLYRVDVSEKDLAQIGEEKLELVVKKIAFFVLKREYKKVWFRKNYN